jgi:serine/threonine-protein kinase RsbW
MPNNLDYLPIIQNAVVGISQIMGFTNDDTSKLGKGIKNAVSNVIKYAFKEDEEATYDLIIEPQTLGLMIVIKDKGFPFDPSMIHKYDPNSTYHEKKYKGLGILLEKQFFDEVSFHNMGKDGMETHLFKYLDRHIQHLVNNEELQKVEKVRTEELLPEKSGAYTVRRMKPEEAIEVSKLAYSAYGYTYINEDIYYPDRLRELNRRNDFISYIAVTDEGKIISHSAFERREDKGIPEIGVAFTRPECRGRGCLNKLTTTLIDEAPKLGLTGIFAQGVTSHPFSQKSLMKFGFRDCALFLSIFAELSFKKIEQKKPQRESVIVSFYSVKPSGRLIIYPPEHHAKIISGLYEHIGFKPEIKTANNKLSPDLNKSVLSVKTDIDDLTADIIIKTYGKDIISEVHRILKDLCINRTEAIYLRMKLNDPFTAKYTAEFEKMGFFFSGILPRSEAGDELILQYLNNYIIDYDQLKIASDKGKEILEYILKNRGNNC